MKIVHRQEYVDAGIELDGTIFTECKFLRCNFLYEGKDSFDLIQCQIVECRFLFYGMASQVRYVLSKLGWREPIDTSKPFSSEPIPGNWKM